METMMIDCYCNGQGHLERNGHTASCNRLQRKDKEQAAKDAIARQRAKQPIKKQKQIKPLSKKKQQDMRTYQVRRKHHLEKHPNCQLKLDVCIGKASEIHHSKGRIGNNLTNSNTFVSACRPCHKKLHDVFSSKERKKAEGKAIPSQQELQDYSEKMI